MTNETKNMIKKKAIASGMAVKFDGGLCALKAKGETILISAYPAKILQKIVAPKTPNFLLCA